MTCAKILAFYTDFGIAGIFWGFQETDELHPQVE